MRNPKIIALAAGLFLLGTFGALAGPLEDGMAAFRAGNYAQARALWQPLATRGDATAENNLGIIYLDGKGVTASFPTAMAWFARSAANGSALGENNLGGVYRDGKGVTRDFSKAFALFQAAAIQGNSGAQFNLGLMYGTGEGTRIDNVHAFMWFNLAAAQGLPNAAAALSVARSKMTAAQIQHAVAITDACRLSSYKNCA